MKKLAKLPRLPAVAKTDSGEASPTFCHANATFCVYRPYMESTSREMNDDDLNLLSMTTNYRAGLATVFL